MADPQKFPHLVYLHIFEKTLLWLTITADFHTRNSPVLWFCRNQGFLPDKLTLDLLPLTGDGHASSSAKNHNFECVLRCGEEGGWGEGEGVLEVRVTCMGRRDGQQAAAQAMLKVGGCPFH